LHWGETHANQMSDQIFQLLSKKRKTKKLKKNEKQVKNVTVTYDSKIY